MMMSDKLDEITKWWHESCEPDWLFDVAKRDIHYLLAHVRQLKAEIVLGQHDLKLNAAMLAKQTDLARKAEVELEAACREIKRLNGRW